MKLSSYIVAPLAAWLVAQILKYVIAAIRSGNRRDFSYLYKSGNMPSSHSALMIALLTVIGVRDGMDSAVFGMAFVLSIIILYDAINVRRAVGEQGTVLKKVLVSLKQDGPLYLAQGHTLTEVAVGCAIGFLGAVAVLQFI